MRVTAKQTSNLTRTISARVFPFLGWFPVNASILRGDLVAGITGALVLVPKAMAYAQLSGLPVYFGLYVAFVPAIVGALWGSSRQLSTGPVAIVSLMTAAAVAPLAVPFSEEFIGLALLLAMMVGVIQFSLGALKLGTIVNFVSHPVILGFMNAAAFIIALSQVNMLLGVPKDRSGWFLFDIWEMLGYLPQAHLPTLAMSAFALALMLGLKRIPALAKLSVLIAVIVTILISALVGYERKVKVGVEQITDATTARMLDDYIDADARINELNARLTALGNRARQAQKTDDGRELAEVDYSMDLLRLDVDALKDTNRDRLQLIRKMDFELIFTDGKSTPRIWPAGQTPEELMTDGYSWQIKKITSGEINLVSGGDVVGKIPSGLPTFRIPPLSLDAVLQLLTAAFIIALVAFMESISMASECRGTRDA